MDLIDRVFLALFARYRRKLGEPQVNVAWIRAVGKIAGFLILPTAALTFVLVVVTYLFNGLGSPTDHMRWGKIAASVGWLTIAILLQARFSKYLREPPLLSHEESAGDRRVILWFHTACIGFFLMTCAVAVILHVLGLASRLGF
jgi:hypothetical protein